MNKTSKIVLLSTLAVLLISFTHCVSESPVSSTKTGSASGDTYVAPQDAGQIIQALEVTTGVKNHEQIYNTMAAVTGTSPSATLPMSTYNSVVATLPTDNDAKVFMPPQQLAVTKLAAAFCEDLIENNTTSRSIIFPNIDFMNLRSVAFMADPALRDHVISRAILAFWGNGMVTAEERDLATVKLNELMVTLKEGTADNAAAMRLIIRGSCTAVLASAPVTLL